MDRQTFVSYAQNGEDVVLWRALGHVRDGRYVDVGAGDPELDSVTKAFVDRGWRGIDIEPVPYLAERLREARPDNEVVAAAVTDEQVDHVVLHLFDETGLSTLDDRAARSVPAREAVDVTVPATTLDDVCADSALLLGDLHVLKVDVEGLEAAVLRSISLEKWRPWVVVVEATVPNSAVPSHAEWESLLTDSGYRCALFDGLNRYYVSADHPELVEPLSYPACVLDGFQRAAHVQLAKDLRTARSEISRWRNMAIGGFAESTSVAQASRARMVNMKKRIRKLEETLEVTREKLFAVRRTNRTLTTKLDRLESHLEVRVRRRTGRLLRRARGRS